MIGIKEIISSLGGNLFKGATELIDEITTSKEEKETLKIQMQSLINNELESYLKDTQNARDRDIQANNSVNASWLAKNITPLIAMVAISLTFGLFYYSFRATIRPESKDIVIYVLGALSTVISQIISYYFGSSKTQTNQAKL